MVVGFIWIEVVVRYRSGEFGFDGKVDGDEKVDEQAN
jgi:hypothetical protein